MTGEVTLHMALAINCPKTVKSILQARTGIPDYDRQDREMLETNVLNVAIMYGDEKSIREEIFKERPIYRSDYYLNYAYDTAIEFERHDLLEMLNTEINMLVHVETGLNLPPLLPPAERPRRGDRLAGFTQIMANAFRPNTPRPEAGAAAGAISMDDTPPAPPSAPRLRPTPPSSTPPHPSIPDEIWRRLVDDAPREADGNLLRR